jgi:hypothetical protein
MQLAKNVIDLGLSTNNWESTLRFWQHDAGLRFDHVLPVRRGQKQTTRWAVNRRAQDWV